ncbi:hypothetical protein [Nocardioides lijunqiniae]|uniref:hypothetical protein n=1 Tax=Nocardioides lijunqiniae TaxID=2760832 RepID=UPI0018780D02|nr:hypothetical protein [Nocardioides lijunqiniae]
MRSRARSTLLSLALTSALAGTLAAATPASAEQSLRGGAASARAGQVCTSGVLGQDAAGHLTQHVVRNGRVIGTRRTTAPLPFEITALGYVDVRDGRARVSATTTNGTRMIRFTEPRRRPVLKVTARRLAPQRLSPALFTDAYGYYAYTVDDAGVLHRWTLVQRRDGSLAYGRRLRVAGGLQGLTALTTAALRAAPRADLLYAVTARGALRLLTIPHAKPRTMRAKTLKRRGYAGVTELASGFCTGDDRGAVVALDPVAGTATWTVVSRLTSGRAVARAKGEVRGRADWRLHGVI